VRKPLPYLQQVMQVLGFAHYMLKRCDQALPLVRDSGRRVPNLRPARAWLAATYAPLGQIERGRRR
jgi:hypothetical protein